MPSLSPDERARRSATRLFDGTGTATRADPLIVVSDGRISSIDEVGPCPAVPPTPSW
jgi:hypothetical protein